METSHFEIDPETPTPDEAAAIVAAIEHFERSRRTDETATPTPNWSGRRWAFAGRLAAVRGRSARVPDGAPSDPWTAAGRLDRIHE